MFCNYSDSRDRVYSNFVSLAVRLLHGWVIGILVRDEEGGLDVTAVGILSVSVKDVFVQLDVVVVDGIIEGDGDHLGNVLGWEVPRNRSAILWTEAVRQHTDRRVARRGAVRVIVVIWTRQGELAGRGTFSQAAPCQLSLSTEWVYTGCFKTHSQR